MRLQPLLEVDYIRMVPKLVPMIGGEVSQKSRKPVASKHIVNLLGGGLLMCCLGEDIRVAKPCIIKLPRAIVFELIESSLYCIGANLAVQNIPCFGVGESN